jgi:NAD(P)-dependent dehydrogenase (short-subunit alcohol dehydrogenase family)
MNRLNGQVIVVTGASGLLGRQHCLAILSEGGAVVMIDINQKGLDDFKNSISKEQTERLLSFVCDIREESQVLEVARVVELKLGKVTGLVNNAAINPSVEKNTSRFERFENLTREAWNEELDVGIWGSVVCSRVFGSMMVSSGNPGSIVNISSDHGIIAPMQHLYSVEGLPAHEQPVKPVTYSVVKHGLIGLTRYLATYWAGENIRVNALSPGGVENGQNPIFSERFKEVVPMRRFAKPHEYRGALVFLLSEESSYMTGSVLVVDGGRTIW